MVIFVFGDDAYRVEAKLRQLTEHFRAKYDKGGMNVDHFDAADVAVSVAREVIVAPPFLAAKRFVVVRRFSAWAEDEVFHALTQAVPESSVVVFVDPIPEKEFQAMKLEKTLIDWHEYPFAKLPPMELAAFAIEEAKRHGAMLSPAVANELLKRVPLDSWSVATEVAKLASAVPNGVITRELVAEHLGERADDKIFDLVDAIATGSVPIALRLLENQLAYGSHPFQLLTMIERQVRLLVSARSAFEHGMKTPDAIASALGVHPFVARKLLASVQRPDTRLTSLLPRIAELDSQMKTGRVEPVAGLTLLLTR